MEPTAGRIVGRRRGTSRRCRRARSLSCCGRSGADRVPGPVPARPIGGARSGTRDRGAQMNLVRAAKSRRTVAGARAGSSSSALPDRRARSTGNPHEFSRAASGGEAHLASRGRSRWSPTRFVADEAVSALESQLRRRRRLALDEIRHPVISRCSSRTTSVAAQVVCDRVAVTSKGAWWSMGRPSISSRTWRRSPHRSRCSRSCARTRGAQSTEDAASVCAGEPSGGVALHGVGDHRP